ncbi:MAG: metallophosphoesterase [Pseudomonadales bacterium]|nr:metallophosphoesterase [Pseudomonadales bacterium]
MKNSALLLLIFLLTACSSPPTIQHDLADSPLPWSSQVPDYDQDTVRFAVFSDLTGGEREGVFETAVAQLNLLRPELIVNVGDLIEGGEDRQELIDQWDSFDERVSRAGAPVIYTGGNHDLMGQTMREVWAERLGPRYFHVRYRDILFLILDTDDHTDERMQEIIKMRTEAYKVAMSEGWGAFGETAYANHSEDQTGMISAEQSAYMQQALQNNDNVRWTFVLSHKAPWANDDMPTWQAVEAVLADRPYTVFHGHRHAYKHTVRNDRDYIQLATTGGVFLPQNGPTMDQLVWVTVDEKGAHIANLKMTGIFDKTGEIPAGGEDLCLKPPCMPNLLPKN